jgi:lipopolysaccharide transport system ATP-binding protein
MSGKRLDTLIAGQDADVYMHYETTEKFRGSGIVASIIVRTQMDVPVFLQHNRLTGVSWETVPTEGAFVCRIKNLPLPPAAYYLGFSIVRHGVPVDGLSEAVEMIVAEGDFFGSGEVPPISHGVCLVNAEWRLEG